MTTDDIIKLAKECGFPFNKYDLLQGDHDGEIDADEMLEAFFHAAQKLGASQAQQTTEPELPEHSGVMWREQNINLYPGISFKLTKSGESLPRCVEYKLYTATQMHDHYQAGVRAGMAQSQDAKRLDWLNQTLFMSKWNGVIDSGSKVTWHIAPYHRHTTLKMTGNTLREAIDSAMQGGQQP